MDLVAAENRRVCSAMVPPGDGLFSRKAVSRMAGQGGQPVPGSWQKSQACRRGKGASKGYREAKQKVT